MRGRLAAALQAAGLLAKTAETLASLEKGHALQPKVEQVCAQLLIDTPVGMQLQDGQEGVEREGKALSLGEELEAAESMRKGQTAKFVAYDKVLDALAKIADSSAETAAVVQGMKQSQAVLMETTEKLVSAVGDMREGQAAVVAAVEKLLASTTEETGRRRSNSADAHIEEMKLLEREAMEQGDASKAVTGGQHS
ncbi:hypothetical protein FOA52_009782 [Chlamydomonas sp. UWO 241]|nr:hypothetical protein FOA52_009782 [Chlamydomonas sp. UWO 241]